MDKHRQEREIMRFINEHFQIIRVEDDEEVGVRAYIFKDGDGEGFLFVDYVESEGFVHFAGDGRRRN